MRRVRWVMLVGLAVAAVACVPSPGAGAPRVTGDPVVGAVLNATTGDWLFEPTSYSYTWRSCSAGTSGECVTVGGSTSSYTGFPASKKNVAPRFTWRTV